MAARRHPRCNEENAMADVTVTSASRSDGIVTVLGSGFTRTTTFIFIDGVEAAFTLVSDAQVTVEDADGKEVHAEKGGVITDPVEINEETTTMQTEDTIAGGTAGATGQPAVPITADDVKTEQEKGAPDPVEPVPERTIAEPLTLGPREPYPQGSPPDPEDQFFAAHGFRRAPE
jgi:hypothetical protein